VDVRLLIKQRLQELGLEQKDLATAAGVTASYISQLLAGRKLPPEPDRTDIYVKMGKFLKLPAGKLSELAEHQRTEELTEKLSGPPMPLHKASLFPRKKREYAPFLKDNLLANWSAL
jgi:transcriptional regulator with XRE-family HTH domain